LPTETLKVASILTVACNKLWCRPSHARKARSRS